MDARSTPFAGNVALLGHLLDARPAIVVEIERRLLNQRVRAPERFWDRDDVAHRLSQALYGQVPQGLRPFIGELAARHRAAGFHAVQLDGFTHELDPLELAARARLVWARTRWPGSSGRLAYALVVFAAFVVRQLEYLSLRVWDEGEEGAPERLRDVQRLLDRLNAAIQPSPFVRDARWLVQTAQGALTPDPRPYFEIAERVDRSFDTADRLEVHRAGALLAGGHLRSQLRYRMWEFRLPIDAPEILAVTRNSNSMDTALLVRDLVALLEAYRRERREDREAAIDLADAILQGLSADPELLLVRLDLLRPLTMIEELFVSAGRDESGRARLSDMGQAHVGLLERYYGLIRELIGPLMQDATAFDPAAAAYSPLGITYGFCADLLSNIAQSRLVAVSSDGLSMEDTFSSRYRLDDKRARASGWAGLPRLDGEREHFGHSTAWGSEVFSRLMHALALRAQYPGDQNASGRPSGRLFVAAQTSHVGPESGQAGAVPGAAYCFSSDPNHPSSAIFSAAPEVVEHRREGRFLASVQAGGQWFAISKNVLTMETVRGRDVVVTGVPDGAAAVLRVTCPSVVTTSD